MATRIQFRRGTTAQHASFTGAVGEMTVDTDKEVVVVHDGSTAGGFEMARADMNNVTNPQFGGTGSMQIPKGTTAQRPASPDSAEMRYNTTNAAMEFYTGSTWASFGSVMYWHHFEDATRNITTSTGSTGTILSFNFTKQYANSYIILRGYFPVSGQNSYHSGSYVEVGGTRSYDAAKFVSPPGGAGDDNIYGFLHIDGIWTGISTTGSKTVTLGWASRDGSSQRPGNYYNASQRAARARSNTGIVDIWEVSPSAVANFT